MFADDHHLYISCGYYEDPHPSWGLHLFDLRTQRRIVRSTNGSGSFNYEFHPGGSTDEEPEGLTYWDLDGRNAPGIKGQLHAILLDNDANGDDVYFKHYRVQGAMTRMTMPRAGRTARVKAKTSPVDAWCAVLRSLHGSQRGVAAASLPRRHRDGEHAVSERE